MLSPRIEVRTKRYKVKHPGERKREGEASSRSGEKNGLARQHCATERNVSAPKKVYSAGKKNTLPNTFERISNARGCLERLDGEKKSGISL